MENIIIANTHYWLDYLGRKSSDSTLSDADLEGAAKALDKDEYKIALIHLNMGNTYLSHGDFEHAEQASLQAETMFEQLADQPYLARARHNLGMIYTYTADWEKAERCFLWAVEHWQSRQDNWNLANSMGELAAMYIAWGKREQAQHYLDAVAQRIEHRTNTSYQGLQRELAERREKLAVLYTGASTPTQEQ